MSKSKNPYNELDHIREDLDSLKNNVIELTRHLSKDGNAQAAQLKSALKDKIGDIQASGRTQYKNLEKQVKAKPGQTLAMAFAAGVVASMLLGSRR